MKRCVFLCPAVAACAFFACRGQLPSTGTLQKAGGEQHAAAAQQTPPAPWQGVATCTSAGCHDTNGKPGSPGSEYSTWITADPHARAYEVLLESRSQDIVRNLHGAAPAHENDRCLGCHVRPGFQWQQRHNRGVHGPRFAAADGVGCESCHGPSGKWLTKHYREDWKSLSPKAKAEQWGMRDTKSLVGRVGACVDCHVGKPGMDVNHDLLAAGHPRLAFEFGVYHANLPHHWDDARDKDPARDDPKGPRRGRRDFEAAAWAVGQAVSARAALDLLAARADPSAKHPWPELAEHDCFACHHNLQGKSWRQSPNHYGRRPPGAMPWSDWYNRAALDVALVPVQTSLRADLNVLGKLLETKVISGRKGIAGRASAAAAKLGEAAAALETIRYSPERVRDLMEQLCREAAKRPLRSWDDAEQSYLALNALYHAWKDLAPQGGPPAGLHAQLAEFAGRLAFPIRRDSPGPEFTPQGARECCRAVSELLRRRKKAGD